MKLKKVTKVQGKHKLKPLSVNQCYLGRKRKSGLYRTYERNVKALIMKLRLTYKGPLQAHFAFGFSSKASDYDNCIKPLQDILQDVFEFNDNKIYKATVEKHIVDKGSEYFYYHIYPFKGRINKIFEEF